MNPDEWNYSYPPGTPVRVVRTFWLSCQPPGEVFEAVTRSGAGRDGSVWLVGRPESYPIEDITPLTSSRRAASELEGPPPPPHL